MKYCVVVFVLAFGLISMSTAFARSDEVLIDAKEAVALQGKGDLLNVDFYMKGQEHPKVKKKIGHWSSTRKGRGAFQSDMDACSRTFVSALKSLQQRALREGGNAVINITSFTKDIPYEHPSKFRCVAGAVIVHVAIEGDVVQLEK
ncbi:MAG: excinuclease ABC subunit A [Gammaproteobacteria bacterium]|nr:excinuclease ABC subunit A [Gammaproteobacteria bacterium]